jgi:hypothetical protein
MITLSIFVRAFYLSVILMSCSAINQRLGLADDNIGEEILEEVLDDAIQYETGFKPNIDFTPGSPE